MGWDRRAGPEKEVRDGRGLRRRRVFLRRFALSGRRISEGIRFSAGSAPTRRSAAGYAIPERGEDAGFRGRGGPQEDRNGSAAPPRRAPSRGSREAGSRGSVSAKVVAEACRE